MTQWRCAKCGRRLTSSRIGCAPSSSVTTHSSPRRWSTWCRDFVAFSRQIERAQPSELALHLILDNSSTHKTEEVQRFLKAHSRFRFHFTPTSASWLNAAETWFSQLERRSLHRGVFTSVADRRSELCRYIQAHNDESTQPFVWTKTAQAILDAVSRARDAAEEEAN